MVDAIGLNAVAVNDVERVQVGPGCYRRDLPSRAGVRFWIVDMDPGAEWPHVDRHGLTGEDIYVSEGTLLEGNERFGAGTFL